MFATDEGRAALASLTVFERAKLERIVGVRIYYDAVRWNARFAAQDQFRNITSNLQRRTRGVNRAAMCEAVPAMVDAMVVSGALVRQELSAGLWRIVSPSAAAPEGTGAERSAAYRRRLMERLAPDMDEAQRGALAELFREWRMATWPLSSRLGQVELRGERQPQGVVYCPKAIMADASGVYPLHGLLFGISVRGRFAQWSLNTERLQFSPGEEGRPRVVADLDGVRHQPIDTAISRVLPRLTVFTGLPATLTVDWPGTETRLGFAIPGKVRQGMLRAHKAGMRSSTKIDGMMRGLLDRGILAEAARAFPRVGVREYHWFSAPSETVRQRRIQAARAYPLLAPFMVSNAEVKWAVDRAQPLAPLLMTHAGLSAPMLRRIGRLYWQRTGVMVVDEMGRDALLSRSLNLCAPEWLPQSRADWRGFQQSYIEVRRALQSACFPQGSGQEAEFLRGALSWLSDNWQTPVTANQAPADMITFIGQLLKDAVIGHLRAAMQAAEPDWVPRLLVDDHTQWGGYTQGPAVNRALVFGARPSFRSLTERAVAWHERTLALSVAVQAIARDEPLQGAREAPSGQPDTWPALDADFQPAGGGSIRWLTSAAALAAEAEHMGHCVWSYDAMCLFDGSHIGSVTGARGGRSTVELRFSREEASWRLHVLQHQGLGNKHPAADCKAMLDQFIAERTRHIDAKALAEASLQRQRFRPDRRASFDTGSPRQRIAVIDLCRAYMHPKLRRLGVSGLAQLVLSELAAADMPAPADLELMRQAVDRYGDGLPVEPQVAVADVPAVAAETVFRTEPEPLAHPPLPALAEPIEAITTDPGMLHGTLLLSRTALAGLRGAVRRLVGAPADGAR